MLLSVTSVCSIKILAVNGFCEHTTQQEIKKQIPYLSISTSIEPEASSTLQRCSFMYMSLGHHDVLNV